MLLDMGLEEDLAESQGVQNLKVMHGSHFWARRDAMSEDEMMDALFSGLQLGENLAEEGIRPSARQYWRTGAPHGFYHNGILFPRSIGRPSGVYDVRQKNWIR